MYNLKIFCGANVFVTQDMPSDARHSAVGGRARTGGNSQMLIDPGTKVAGSAPDVAGITCRTGIFVNELGA